MTNYEAGMYDVIVVGAGHAGVEAKTCRKIGGKNPHVDN